MIRVCVEKQEALAKGIAMGLSGRKAGNRAGFSATNDNFYNWLELPEFIERIEKHRRALNPAATNDLRPIIERLVAAADKAAGTDGPTLRAVRELLSEAARLKQLLPAEDTAPIHYELTREEWLAAFAPK